MQWIRDMFGVHKPIIAMCHLHALPAITLRCPQKGVEWIVEQGRKDLHALEQGGASSTP